jgi:hypothetical protein
MLNFSSLRDHVQNAKFLHELVCELKYVLGNSFLGDGPLEEVLEEAHSLLETKTLYGKKLQRSLSNKTTLMLAESTIPVARKVATFFLPVSQVNKFLFDNDQTVRFSAAKRADLKLLEKAVKKYDGDDHLEMILSERKNNDSTYSFALSDPEKTDKDAEKTDENLLDLSDFWYDQQADLIIQDYGKRMDYQSMFLAVKRFAQANFTYYHVDEKKLMKAVEKKIAEIDKERQDESVTLPKVVFTQKKQDIRERLLTDKQISRNKYVDSVSKLYNVIESQFKDKSGTLLSEGIDPGTVWVPVKASLPKGRTLSELDERVLDKYVKNINYELYSKGHPVTVTWVPESSSTVRFVSRLK